MHHSGSPPDPAAPLVGDASFWINLVATRRAELLIEAFGAPLTITDVALAELGRGRAKGRATADPVDALVQRGTVEVLRCAPEDEELFLSLVAGSALTTLDDGEAATLVCAARVGGVAVIDERKARSLAAARFPKLGVLSTVDLLLGPAVAAVGVGTVADAIFDALTGARMRVPSERLNDVAALIGPERAVVCHSLPSSLRRSADCCATR